MELELTNVINISVSESPVGIGAYNTSNIALFTEEPYAVSFGVLGYKIYLSPSDVATDFGTSSKTYKQALKIFSQKPNMLQGDGYLVVIPMITEVQNFALSGVPASGTFTLSYLGNPTANINWNDTAAQIQVKLRAVAGLEAVEVTGSLASQAIQVLFKGVYGNLALLTVGGAGLQTSAPAAITITPTETTTGETIDESIARTEDLVQYFGIISDLIHDETDTLAAAAVVQTLNKIMFFVQRDSAEVEEDGILDLLRQNGYDQSRGLYYGADNDLDAILMMAAYAGRALSTNFSGSQTTQTMHLKDLIGVVADPTMTQTILNLCQDAGADAYPSLQGVAKVFCSGANKFFDRVYNREWFVGALEVAGFNFLAQTSTKIPQTESGMSAFKNAFRQVCEDAVTNEFVAPGTWNSPDTFGVQQDFYNNITNRGYYIYSQPIALQSQTDREDREAPLIQIAIKEAGAIHSASVIVNINA